MVTNSVAEPLEFDRDFFDREHRFKTIGEGSLGGKAHGLAVAHRILSLFFDRRQFRRVDVDIPSLAVVRTGVFREFLKRNGFENVGADVSDEDVAREFQRGELPPAVVGDLRAVVEQAHTPLAIRSSSLLEDDLSQPFAGVYRTKMIPNNQPSADDRFRRLVEAIKFIYASAFFRSARTYLDATGRAGLRDEMAVVVQEVVGTRFGDRFYPHISGVGRSYNYYRSGYASAADGVVNLALGLGKTIVDGGVCWTYSPAWPTAPAPFPSAAAVADGTQNEFWAVNMGKPPAHDPIHETEYLVRCGLPIGEKDGTLNRVASTFDVDAGQIRMGIGSTGPRVLDFAMLLAFNDPPVNDVVRALLRLFEDKIGAAVEIEFAVTFDPHRFGLLQVRPMMVSSDEVTVGAEEMHSKRVLAGSVLALGNGVVNGITDVVYVRPESFSPQRTPAIAAELERVNASLLRAGRPYLLIGFGRWGSSDPSLGIPVEWAQISGARAIVEAMTPGMTVELSQGSHFFHNLSSFHVPYFSIPAAARPPIDWEWLGRQPAISESAVVRHVTCGEPLEIRVDGRSGLGVILKGERA